MQPNESKFLDRLGRQDAGGQAQDSGPRAGPKGLVWLSAPAGPACLDAHVGGRPRCVGADSAGPARPAGPLPPAGRGSEGGRGHLTLFTGGGVSPGLPRGDALRGEAWPGSMLPWSAHSSATDVLQALPCSLFFSLKTHSALPRWRRACPRACGTLRRGGRSTPPLSGPFCTFSLFLPLQRPRGRRPGLS